MKITKPSNPPIDQKSSHQNHDNFNIFTEAQKLSLGPVASTYLMTNKKPGIRTSNPPSQKDPRQQKNYNP